MRLHAHGMPAAGVQATCRVSPAARAPAALRRWCRTPPARALFPAPVEQLQLPVKRVQGCLIPHVQARWAGSMLAHHWQLCTTLMQN